MPVILPMPTPMLTEHHGLRGSSSQGLESVAHVTPGYGVVGAVLLGERLRSREGEQWF